MNITKVVFADHCKKHGLTEEDIVYAAENITAPIEHCRYGNELYIRFVGKHRDVLNPQIGVVLKVTTTKIVIVYHADAAIDGFFDIPFVEWIRKNSRNQNERNTQ